MPPAHSREIALDIPQAGGFIITGSENLCAIGTKYGTSDTSLMPPEHSQEIALDIPQAGGFICLICTSGEDLPTIGAKYATAEATLMPQKHGDLPAKCLHGWLRS